MAHSGLMTTLDSSHSYSRSVSVIPENDIVPKIDAPSGLVQRITCADHPSSCHSTL